MTSAYADEYIETMPRDDLMRLQEARLMRMIRFAYENAPLIRSTWDAAGVKPSDIRSIADFREKAPFTDKDAVRQFRDTHNDPCGGLKAVSDEELSIVASTSGTTGDPTPVLIGKRTPNQIGMMRDYWHLGVRPGDFVTRPIFTFRGGHYRWPFEELGWKSLLFSHSPAEVPRIFEGSKRFRPTGFMMVSSPLLLAFEQEIDRTGQDPKDIFSSYKMVVFGGEPLGARQKKLAERLGLNLYEMGSVGDALTGSECTMRSGFHVWEDLIFAECLDPETNAPIPAGGQGELVITMLTDRFNPMVRFRTGDLVRFGTGVCGCGRTHARMHLLGRTGDRMMVGDTVIMPRLVQEMIECHAPARAGLFQFVRPSNDMDHLHLRVGYEEQHLNGSLDKFGDDLRDSLTAQLSVTVKIELTPVSELLKLGPPHKIPRITKA